MHPRFILGVRLLKEIVKVDRNARERVVEGEE
jgi:hypothetical protein